jgi:hypothetical protein
MRFVEGLGSIFRLCFCRTRADELEFDFFQLSLFRENYEDL